MRSERDSLQSEAARNALVDQQEGKMSAAGHRRQRSRALKLSLIVLSRRMAEMEMWRNAGNARLMKSLLLCVSSHMANTFFRPVWVT